MKRKILGYVAVMVTVICLCAAPSFAADNFKIGVGYQGLIAGNVLNGLSVRGWFGPKTAIGVEANGFYGSAKISVDGSSSDLSADLWMIELKPMYAFIVRDNSRFYGGLKGAYGKFNSSASSDLIDGSFWMGGLLVGAEWNFPVLPEVGFNFEVGYNYISNSNDVGSSPSTGVDIKLHGINVGAGIKYYF
ncbi:MAG: porin family protein [Deltaproteobacteria bacterium]